MSEWLALLEALRPWLITLGICVAVIAALDGWLLKKAEPRFDQLNAWLLKKVEPVLGWLERKLRGGLDA